MPELFGESIERVRERIGSLTQAARIDSFVEANGVGHGARRLRLVNGGGIELEIYPDRALDIGQATVDGRPVAWASSTGMTTPDAAEPEGSGWLRTFGGGLLATCGLDTFGAPSKDEGETFGQHGRIGTQRANLTRVEVTDDELIVEGTMRQTRVFGENLVLRRRISSRIGSDSIRINDVIVNESYRDQPHMVLYHMNLGWPLLGDNTTIETPATRVTPRDADAELGIDEHSVYGPPRPAFREQVFTHELPAGPASILVANPDNGLSFELSIDANELPFVFQWKMADQGVYALGIEPANTSNLFGRASARAADELPILTPGEQASYSLNVRLRRDPSIAATSKEEAL